MTTNGQEIPREVIVKRLKKVEGQVRGLQKMLTDGRDCESIVTQLTAVRSALESVGQLVLNNYMHICFRKEVNIEDTAESLARVVAIWSRVHVGDKKSKS